MTRAEQEESSRWYLAAIIDGEGYVSYKTRKIIVSNTDLDILNFIEESLKLLQIDYTIEKTKKYKAHHKQAYSVVIQKRKATDRAFELLPLQSSKKKINLEKIHLSKRHKQRDEWPIDKIKKLYDEGYGTTTIARKLNIKSERSVSYYMKQSGMQLRKRYSDGYECKRGHKFSVENTYYASNGTKHCKGCKNLLKRKVKV